MSHAELSATLSASPGEQPIFERLHVPFAPLTLQRPLALFGKALGLCPGVSGCPDPDFIVHVLEGAGHQQLLRHATTSQFRNLANFLRGAHAPTATSLRLMALALGIDEDALRSLAHDRPDGPLLPAYVSLFQALEGLFVRAYRGVTVGKLMCPCGGDLLADAHVWWTAQPLTLAPGAAAFVDRLLGALLGGVFLLEIAAKITQTQAAHLDRARLHQLANCRRHPIGNWIEMARLGRGVRHDWELLNATELDGRMRKWRSGQGLLPLAKAHAMLAGAPDEAVLLRAMLAARTLSLAIDVVQATSLTASKPSRALAQQIVAERIHQLDRHLQLGGAGWENGHSNKPPLRATSVRS